MLIFVPCIGLLNRFANGCMIRGTTPLGHYLRSSVPSDPGLWFHAMSLNLASLFSNSARLYPELPAVIYDNVRLRYCDVEEAAARFAGELLAGGIQPGDKVALMIPNVPAFTIAYFGVLRAGGVVVPLSTLLVANEVAFQLEDSEAKACVVHRQCAAVAWEALERVPGCRLVYTVEMDRGTTAVAEQNEL